MKEALHAVALGIAFAVEAGLVVAQRMRMDDGLNPFGLEAIADGPRVIGGVGYERDAVCVLVEELLGDRSLVLLTWRDCDVNRAAFGVDDGVDLRRETTSRTTQGIVFDPPFPPAASWCARTTEASMIRPSSSVSNCSALKMAAQWPLWDQFENRLYTVFQAPNRSGRSRQGTPVFARYKTASINFLSSSRGCGPRRFGTNGCTNDHWASVNAWRCVTSSFDHITCH
jgi:hypothetical protein